jgi:hypothetical protein
MAFKFHPFSSQSAADAARIGKELHRITNEELLVKYAKSVVEEARAANNIVIELMLEGEKPYVIRIFDSTRAYDKDARVSIVVCYRSGEKLEEIGLISLPEMFCAQTEEDV